MFLTGSLLDLLPQQTVHLLQAALTACALPHTSEGVCVPALSCILTSLQSRTPNAEHRVPICSD